MNLSDLWHEYLVRLRDAYLDTRPTHPDRSAAPRVLAHRAAVRWLLPGRVHLFSHGPTRVVRLDLGQPFGFTRTRLTKAAREVLLEVQDNQTISITEPNGTVVWIAIDAAGHPLTPLQLSIEPSVQLASISEEERRSRVLRESFEEIGYRPLKLQAPDGSPDPRMRAVARWRPDTQDFGMPSPHDLVSDLELTRTLIAVPDYVDGLVAKARLLFLHGWHQWEFFTDSKRDVTLALEASLREVLERGKGVKFVALIDTAGKPAGHELLSSWERGEAHRLREWRNRAVHPSGPPALDWISWAFADLVLAVRLINLMWARRTGSAPREWGWEE